MAVNHRNGVFHQQIHIFGGHGAIGLGDDEREVVCAGGGLHLHGESAMRMHGCELASEGDVTLNRKAAPCGNHPDPQENQRCQGCQKK